MKRQAIELLHGILVIPHLFYIYIVNLNPNGLQNKLLDSDVAGINYYKSY
jgi:hypothetical protein